jgi:predicted nucleotidyltransferase
VIAVYVFGSRARGTARADSDLDLAFELDETRETASDLAALVVNRPRWQEQLTKVTGLVVRDLQLRSDPVVGNEVVEVYRRTPPRP